MTNFIVACHSESVKTGEMQPHAYRLFRWLAFFIFAAFIATYIIVHVLVVRVLCGTRMARRRGTLTALSRVRSPRAGVTARRGPPRRWVPAHRASPAAPAWVCRSECRPSTAGCRAARRPRSGAACCCCTDTLTWCTPAGACCRSHSRSVCRTG